jgi:hypothetical protein
MAQNIIDIIKDKLFWAGSLGGFLGILLLLLLTKQPLDMPTAIVIGVLAGIAAYMVHATFKTEPVWAFGFGGMIGAFVYDIAYKLINQVGNVITFKYLLFLVTYAIPIAIVSYILYEKIFKASGEGSA